MRADIITTNRPAICESLKALRQQLDALIEILGRDETDALLDWLSQAKDTRDQWIKQKRDQ